LFGGYGLALAALALVVFGAFDSYPFCLFQYEPYLRLLFYAPEAETARLLSALKRTKLVPWNNVNQISRLNIRMENLVQTIAAQVGCRIQRYEEGVPCYVMWMSPEDSLALKDVE